jgi:hypothetical protein
MVIQSPAVLGATTHAMAAEADVPPIPVMACTNSIDDFKPACLSNGVIGMRPTANPLVQAQTLVGGFVRTHPTMLVESLSPAPYPLATDITLNGQSLLGNPVLLKIKDQTLDMSAGELSTEMDGKLAVLEG